MASSSLRRGRTLGVFDSGIGGIPVAARIRQLAPEIRLVYFGDAAHRPYGPLPSQEVAEYTAEAERLMVDAGCDAWVIACNTASVVAAHALTGSLPYVDMVSSAASAAPPPSAGPLAILATEGTVSSGAFLRALPDHIIYQISTEQLLRLAEEGASDDPRLLPLAMEAMATARSQGCTSAILACTDFTCIIDKMKAAAGGIRLIDPMESAAQRALELLEAVATLPGQSSGADRTLLSASHPTDILRFAKDRFGLVLPRVEYINIGPEPEFANVVTSDERCK